MKIFEKQLLFPVIHKFDKGWHWVLGWWTMFQRHFKNMIFTLKLWFFLTMNGLEIINNGLGNDHNDEWTWSTMNTMMHAIWFELLTMNGRYNPSCFRGWGEGS
jgi:hypothetical protein